MDIHVLVCVSMCIQPPPVLTLQPFQIPISALLPSISPIRQQTRAGALHEKFLKNILRDFIGNTSTLQDIKEKSDPRYICTPHDFKGLKVVLSQVPLAMFLYEVKRRCEARDML